MLILSDDFSLGKAESQSWKMDFFLQLHNPDDTRRSTLAKLFCTHPVREK